MKYVFVMLFTGLTLSACHKDVPLTTNSDLGYSYFPVNIGHTVIYDFDSIFIDTKIAVNETLHFQIKEYTESTFPDNSNRPSQRIERYQRKSDTSAWVIKNVWAAIRTKGTAERIEYNQHLVKLLFPVKLDQTWKGNAYTTLPQWDYQFTNVDEKATFGKTTFDSTATVVQVDDSNLIEQNYATETYAKHVGLVYRRNLHIEKTPAGVTTKAAVNTYTFKSFIP